MSKSDPILTTFAIAFVIAFLIAIMILNRAARVQDGLTRGIASPCIGGGSATALAIERMS